MLISPSDGANLSQSKLRKMYCISYGACELCSLYMELSIFDVWIKGQCLILIPQFVFFRFAFIWNICLEADMKVE